MFEEILNEIKGDTDPASSLAKIEAEINEIQEKLEKWRIETAPHEMREPPSWQARVWQHQLKKLISDKEELEATIAHKNKTT